METYGIGPFVLVRYGLRPDASGTYDAKLVRMLAVLLTGEQTVLHKDATM